jgi:hypothetical protein
VLVDGGFAKPLAGETMAMNPGASKRQKELARQERAKEKEEKRVQRKKEKTERGDQKGGPDDVDPDIAGIIPGPQPKLEDE